MHPSIHPTHPSTLPSSLSSSLTYLVQLFLLEALRRQLCKSHV
jgi:hypothetical protein